MATRWSWRCKKFGPACHTGAESCFFDELYEDETLKPFSLTDLFTH